MIKFKNMDYTILLILGCFLIISTTAIYSATWGTKYQGLHVTNLVTFTALLFPMLGISLLDYRFVVSKLSYILYAIGILLLLFVMFKGININGSQRWLNLRFIQFQPSELMKIFVILSIAKWLGKRNGESLRFIKDLLPIAVMVGIPFFMVLIQPDLGTAIVFICILIGMLWIGNVRLSHALIGLVSITAIIAIISSLYFVDLGLFSKIVKPHQLHRIQTFLNPASDPDQSWHVLNSIKAVGMGQLLGEGFRKGTYIQRGYIPYDYADSIYVVIGEEFGFLGSAILILLYFILIYRMVLIAMECEDLVGSYVVIGITSMLTLQIFENIAMHTGLMPLTGIALPFISYGGSSLLTNMSSIGLVLSVKLHRRKEDFLG